jgi:hypothetical protein
MSQSALNPTAMRPHPAVFEPGHLSGFNCGLESFERITDSRPLLWNRKFLLLSAARLLLTIEELRPHRHYLRIGTSLAN